jgi:ribosomal protein L24
LQPTLKEGDYVKVVLRGSQFEGETGKIVKIKPDEKYPIEVKFGGGILMADSNWQFKNTELAKVAINGDVLSLETPLALSPIATEIKKIKIALAR